MCAASFTAELRSARTRSDKVDNARLHYIMSSENRCRLTRKLLFFTVQSCMSSYFSMHIYMYIGICVYINVFNNISIVCASEICGKTFRKRFFDKSTYRQFVNASFLSHHRKQLTKLPLAFTQILLALCCFSKYNGSNVLCRVLLT